MAAIITSKFRLNNAEQFVESFSESAATAYYLFIGRSSTWQTDTDVQGNIQETLGATRKPKGNSLDFVGDLAEFLRVSKDT